MHLITSSTVGTMCSWLVDILPQPQMRSSISPSLRKRPLTHLRKHLSYQVNRYDRAGAKAGLNQYDIYKGHSGPVMGLNFHPLIGPVDFSDLFLTCSVDWTIKSLRSRSLAKPSTTTQTVSPIYSFDEADDYVYDVKWHPAHPAVFASVDGSGKFDLWNLNADTEVCCLAKQVH